MKPDESKPPTTDGDSGRRDRRRRLIRWTITFVGLGLIVLLRTTNAIGDNAVTNILTLILSFVVFMTWWIWFTFRSGYDRGCRWGVNGTLVAAIVVLAFLVEIKGVTGDLVPILGWRLWNSDDEAVALPEASADDARLRRPPTEVSVADDSDNGDPPDENTKQPNAEDEASAAPAATEPVASEDEDPARYDFPEFLGPGRRNHIDGPALAEDWNAEAPEILWTRDVGEGWSGFSAVNGYAFTMEQVGGQELVSCYEVRTGTPVWFHALDARHETFMGQIGPRSVPTVDEGRVYALGATGVLRCLNGANGELLWSRDLVEEVGSSPELELQVVAWGRAASPLIVDQLVVVPGGGPPDRPKTSLLAFDKVSGEPAWQAGDQQISYSSPVLTQLAGKRQIVVLNEAKVTGHDPADGEVLWSFDWSGASNGAANCSQPVPLGDDRLLLSKGYSQGAAVFEIEDSSSGFETNVLWREPRVLKTKFTNVVVHDGYAYGLSEGALECVRLSDGASQWLQPRRERFKHGQILGVGDKLLAVTEEGEIAMVQMTPERYDPRGRLQVLEGQTWNNLCLYGPYLLVRNAQQAACVQLPVAP